MNEVNYKYETLLNPAFGGAVKPHLTGWELFLNSCTLVKKN